MSDASIIKEFLVGLGFKIDGAGFKKFQAGITSATKVATELGKASLEAAAAVEAAVTKVSKQFEDLYYASQRIHSSVENIRATDYAITQMGGSAAGARAAMESMAEFMRSNPGGERFIASLGVSTRTANGELRDTADIMRDLGAQFRGMPYFAAKVRAGMLGIDDRTLQAMIRGTDEFSDRYHRMAASIGVDQQAAAKAGHDFMVDLRDLLTLLTLTGEKLILIFGPAAHAIVTGLVQMHEATGGWSTNLLVLAGAAGTVWLALKPLAFLLPELFGGFEALGGVMTALGVILSGPVGWILAIAAAIGAVLFSSEKFRREFYAAFEPIQPALREVGQAFSELGQALGPIFGAISGGLGRLRDGFVDSFGPPLLLLIRGGVALLVGVLHQVADVLHVITDLLTGHWSKAWDDAKKTAIDALSVIKGAFDAATGRGGAKAPMAAPAPAGGPARPAAPAATPAQAARDVGQQVAAYFQSHGFTREHAQGIAAGMFAESRFNAGAVNPTSGAFGIGQWLGARKAELFRRYGPNPSLGQQLEFMLWEMTNTEKRAGGAIRGQTSARGALEAYVRDFMRPGPGTAGDLARGAQYLSAQTSRPVLATSTAPMAVSVQQKTDIHVHGVSDPKAAGRAAANEQGRVNGDLLRNTKSALS